MRFTSALAVFALALPAAAHAATAPSATACDVRAHGAKGDGKTLDTAAIQAAIDACSAAGGGTVTLGGAPRFISAPLVLKSNVTLEIAAGTTLEGTSDHELYPEIEEFYEHGRQSLLSARDAHHIAITGGGTIDGRGESWWPNRAEGYTRPRLIVFDHCHDVRMEGVTVQNSPMWQIVPYYSDHLVFRNIKVLAPASSHNTDGIDPFSSSFVTIDHVLIDTGDDNVAIKSGQPGSPGPDAPSTDITITDSTFLRGHGMSIGSEIVGGVQRVHAERITFKGTGAGIRIKSNRDRGGDIGPFSFKDITMEDVNTPILITEFYPKIPDSISAEPVTRLTPRFHDISIENVTAKGAKEVGVIVGLPESPIKGLTLKNVKIDAGKGLRIQYAEIVSEGFTPHAAQGPATMVGQGVKGSLK